MKPANQSPRKRRNLVRWMTNRLRRIDVEVNRGTATERQRDRGHQLACALQIAIIKPEAAAQWVAAQS